MNWRERTLLALAIVGFVVPNTMIALFALWAAWEGQRLAMRSWWVPLPASLFVGLCFAVPLFLLLREREVRKQPSHHQRDRHEPRLAKPTP